MKYILPGMGATSQMYSGAWLQLKDSKFIDWPSYNDEKSISELANRLIRKHQITQNDIMIGSSLGGMVALEIASTVEMKRVYLIGSALNPDEVSLVSKLFMPVASNLLVKASQKISSFSNDIIQQMYSKSDPEFIVSMSRAIRNWQGYQGDLKAVKRIHGKKDLFITCPIKGEIIEKGGHLIAISHAHECVDFIQNHS